jgi:hypothetical protein
VQTRLRRLEALISKGCEPPLVVAVPVFSETEPLRAPGGEQVSRSRHGRPVVIRELKVPKSEAEGADVQ